MTIEELAGVKKETSNYANIPKMRSKILRQGFMRNNDNMQLDKIATISDTDYIDATKIRTINAAWLYFEQTTKHNLVIMNICDDKLTNLLRMQETIKQKMDGVILISDNEKQLVEELNKLVHVYQVEDMNEAVHLAYHIASKEENIVLVSIDDNIEKTKHLSAEFANRVFSL